MNREILYRGKVTNAWSGYSEYKGQWIFGGVVPKKYGGTFMCGEVIEPQTGDNRRLITDVDDKTVGQHVCDAKTKDGKTIRIFEHDIIKFDNEPWYFPDPVVVVYDNKHSGFIFRNVLEHAEVIANRDGYYLPVSDNIQQLADRTHVLGNIHDNPELVQWDEDTRKRWI